MTQTSKELPINVILVFFLLLTPALTWAEWHTEVRGIMGTSVSVTLWQEESSVAKKAIDAVMAEMQRIDDHLSPYKPDSELSRLNRFAAKKAQPLSEEMGLLLRRALYYSALTKGAFDISYASVGRQYNYRASEKPSDKTISKALPAINYQWLNLDSHKGTLSFQNPEVAIDLGGIAKGYAVDRAIEILMALGVQHASVSAGGDSRLLGDKRGRPWIIGIKNPRDPDGDTSAVIRLPLSDVAISTSGDYERYFIDENSGQRIHHILNPRTGRSANSVMSVTILGANGIDTDALSTSVFVMGVEQGLALINRNDNFDAILIDQKGKVHYSDGLAAEESL